MYKGREIEVRNHSDRHKDKHSSSRKRLYRYMCLVAGGKGGRRAACVCWHGGEGSFFIGKN